MLVWILLVDRHSNSPRWSARVCVKVAQWERITCTHLIPHRKYFNYCFNIWHMWAHSQAKYYYCRQQRMFIMVRPQSKVNSSKNHEKSSISRRALNCFCFKCLRTFEWEIYTGKDVLHKNIIIDIKSLKSILYNDGFYFSNGFCATMVKTRCMMCRSLSPYRARRVYQCKRITNE